MNAKLIADDLFSPIQRCM